MNAEIVLVLRCVQWSVSYSQGLLRQFYESWVASGGKRLLNLIRRCRSVNAGAADADFIRMGAGHGVERLRNATDAGAAVHVFDAESKCCHRDWMLVAWVGRQTTFERTDRQEKQRRCFFLLLLSLLYGRVPRLLVPLTVGTVGRPAEIGVMTGAAAPMSSVTVEPP